jgi:ribosomal protein L11 methyltransferase
MENAARNGVSDVVRVAKGSLGEAWPFAEPAAGAYDMVLGNLSSRLIQAMAGQLVEALRSGGVLIASGIIEEQEAVCRAALESAGGRIVGVCQREVWLALVVRRGLP